MMEACFDYWRLMPIAISEAERWHCSLEVAEDSENWLVCWSWLDYDYWRYFDYWRLKTLFLLRMPTITGDRRWQCLLQLPNITDDWKWLCLLKMLIVTEDENANVIFKMPIITKDWRWGDSAWWRCLFLLKIFGSYACRSWRCLQKIPIVTEDDTAWRLKMTMITVDWRLLLKELWLRTIEVEEDSLYRHLTHSHSEWLTLTIGATLCRWVTVCWMPLYAAGWLSSEAPYISSVIFIRFRNITSWLSLPSSSNFASVISPILGVITSFRHSSNSAQVTNKCSTVRYALLHHRHTVRWSSYVNLIRASIMCGLLSACSSLLLAFSTTPSSSILPVWVWCVAAELYFVVSYFFIYYT